MKVMLHFKGCILNGFPNSLKTFLWSFYNTFAPTIQNTVKHI